MSGIEPVTAIALGQTALGAVQGIGSANAARAQMDAQAQSVAANAARQRQMLALQQEADTRKRRNLLERTTARARASFGARGLSDSDGSAGALLSGIEQARSRSLLDQQQDIQRRVGSLLSWGLRSR